MVRQVEDEIGVMNMVIGAAHTGCRAMCATSGGGFALMTEAIGMAGMIETPIVCVDVQRAGPATGVPTKTEQGDLWQALGAGQGDYPRMIVAPTSQLDLFQTIPELFNLCDKYQCPGLVLADLLISEGTASIDPDDLDFNVKIDRGELILPNGNGDGANPFGSGYNDNAYLRYQEHRERHLAARRARRARSHLHRRDRRARRRRHAHQRRIHQPEHPPHDGRETRRAKWRRRSATSPPPKLFGPENAAVTLVGWGSTEGVIREAVEKLAARGRDRGQPSRTSNGSCRSTPTRSAASSRSSKQVIIVENNYSGQFARYLRCETGFDAHGHIRKYDGEPFMPHHIVEAVKDQLAGKTKLSVPIHEVCMILNQLSETELRLLTPTNYERYRRNHPPTTPEPGQLTKDTYKGNIHPDWCPGCGDFSVLAALQTALFELGLKPHQVVRHQRHRLLVEPAGLTSTPTACTRCMAARSPSATGVKLGNHELKVICTGGDGDGYGIGGNHFVHTMRRNVDLTYIVMDNQIYGLTTGQTSPTSVKGMKTKSTPYGNVENPINPIPHGDRRRRDLRGARLQRQTKAPGRDDQGRHPAQGLFARGRLQSLRHLQQGQHLPMV